MTPIRRPALPMPTKAEIVELVTFLAANVAIAKEDGHPDRAKGYQAMQNTAKALAERAVDLSEVTRVTVVAGGYHAFEKSDLYDDGCVLDVQHDGHTLKILPTPKPGTFI